MYTPIWSSLKSVYRFSFIIQFDTIMSGAQFFIIDSFHCYCFATEKNHLRSMCGIFTPKIHFTVFSPVQYSNVVTTWNFPRNCLSLSSTYLIDPVFLSCRGSSAILKIVVKNRLFYHIEVPVHRQYSNNV